MATPVCVLKDIMPAQEFEEWVLFHNETPIDDQSNLHYPAAAQSALFFNMKRGKNTPPKKMQDFLVFPKKPDEDQDIDDLLMNGNW